MRPADVIAANRSWETGAVLALFLAACTSPQSPPPAARPGPRTLLYASNSGTFQAAVFNSTWDESLPVDHIGVPLTTTHPLLALDTAHDEIAVADTRGIRFYPRSLDGPPRAVRTLPRSFQGPLHLAVSVEKNWLAVMDVGTSSSSSPQGPRQAQVDVYVFALDANGPTQPLWTVSWTELVGGSETLCRPAIDFARGEIFFCTGEGTLINVYPLVGSGRVSPLRGIEVENFAAPRVLELDSRNGLLYAASLFDHVFVYESSASGKVAPLRTLEGIHARALAVDPEHQELVTVSATESRLSVYASSGSGAAVALRSFLADGAQVVVDPARGEFIVGGGSRLSTYSRQTTEGGTPLRSIWDGGPSAPAGIAVNPAERTLLMVHGSGFVETYLLSGGPPVRTLRGPRTQLDDSKALALDLQRGELFVSNRNAITVHPMGSSGDVAPSRVIAGPNTGLTRPWGLAVDERHDELYVVNHDDWGPEFTIFVYARDANGDVRPKRTIAGPTTALTYPTGIALDLVHDEIMVANYRSVTVYPRLGEGDVAPRSNLESVMGSDGAFDSLSAIAYDPARDELSVSSLTLDRIWVFPRLTTGRSEERLRSFSSGLKNPTGLALVSE